MGPILGGLLVLLVLIFGGLYLWGGELARNNEQAVALPKTPNNEPETPRATADAKILDTVSSSDELASIEADLESTNLDSLDNELDQAGREIDGSPVVQ